MRFFSTSFLLVFVLFIALPPGIAEPTNNTRRLVDELMVFVDKKKFAGQLRDYHTRLILPAVQNYYADKPLAEDPKVLALAQAQIDQAIDDAVFNEQMIENINREYFTEQLSEQELKAIVNILELPNGKNILLNFSKYLHKAQALRVTRGRDMRNRIEQGILQALQEYESRIISDDSGE